MEINKKQDVDSADSHRGRFGAVMVYMDQLKKIVEALETLWKCARFVILIVLAIWGWFVGRPYYEEWVVREKKSAEHEPRQSTDSFWTPSSTYAQTRLPPVLVQCNIILSNSTMSSVLNNTNSTGAVGIATVTFAQSNVPPSNATSNPSQASSAASSTKPAGPDWVKVRKWTRYGDIRTNTFVLFEGDTNEFFTDLYRSASLTATTVGQLETGQLYTVRQKMLRGLLVKKWPWIELQAGNGSISWFSWGSGTFDTYEVVKTNTAM